MSAKATPGPWRWIKETDPYSQAEPRLVSVDGREVCNFGVSASYDQSCGEAPSDADARLIAASPDMRELLERAKDVLDNYADVVDDCDGTKANPALSLCGEIDALLAKIDGVRL